MHSHQEAQAITSFLHSREKLSQTESTKQFDIEKIKNVCNNPDQIKTVADLEFLTAPLRKKYTYLNAKTPIEHALLIFIRQTDPQEISFLQEDGITTKNRRREKYKIFSSDEYGMLFDLSIIEDKIQFTFPCYR